MASQAAGSAGRSATERGLRRAGLLVGPRWRRAGAALGRRLRCDQRWRRPNRVAPLPAPGATAFQMTTESATCLTISDNG